MTDFFRMSKAELIVYLEKIQRLVEADPTKDLYQQIEDERFKISEYKERLDFLIAENHSYKNRNWTIQEHCAREHAPIIDSVCELEEKLGIPVDGSTYPTKESFAKCIEILEQKAKKEEREYLLKTMVSSGLYRDACEFYFTTHPEDKSSTPVVDIIAWYFKCNQDKKPTMLLKGIQHVRFK